MYQRFSWLILGPFKEPISNSGLPNSLRYLLTVGWVGINFMGGLVNGHLKKTNNQPVKRVNGH